MVIRQKMSLKPFGIPSNTVSVSEYLKKLQRVILFGAGSAGRFALNFLRKKNIEVLFFCDNDSKKIGATLNGVPVKSPDILSSYQDVVVLISSDYALEIGQQLKSIGIKKYLYFGYCFDFDRWIDHFETNLIIRSLSKIKRASDLFYDEFSREKFWSLIRFRLTSDPGYLKNSGINQYFHPKVKPETGDTIIDAGAWTGDTAIAFAQALKSKGHIFSFEPETVNYEKLEATIRKYDMLDTITPVQLGLWSDTCTLSFKNSCENSMQYRVDSTGESFISVTSLDNFVKRQNIRKIDLIKMDIEGAELEALKGSQTVIKKFRPKLQISIYHKYDDLWKIPLLVNKLNSNYKFFLGIHKQHFIDTVLYAIDQDLSLKCYRQH
ncbi:MAG: hypothetical protein DRH43_00180 [Deltaproteobacteria bacterium]|nr:MAG: hypothetical protein DRH43_00180 [Deltaproteobacteria bacterium]HHE64585.1 FkbM family methyltransferase [Bacteroidota bacterium]